MPSQTSPEVHIHIHRSPHVTAADFEQLPELLKNRSFQIFSPESSGLDESFQRGMQKIASGDSKVYTDIQSRTDPESAWATLFRATFNSRKTIELFDATPEQERTEAAMRTYGARAVALTGDYQKFLDEARASTARLAEFIRLRDTTISENVATKLPEILDRSPKLRTLSTIGILLTLGDNHQLVDELLRSKGFTVTTNELPPLGISEEVGLRVLRGESFTDSDITKAGAYKLLRSFVSHTSTQELRATLNVCAETMDEQNITEILTLLNTEGSTGVHGYIRNILALRGLNDSFKYTAPTGDIPQSIRLKQSIEYRNGIAGVRTGIF